MPLSASTGAFAHFSDPRSLGILGFRKFSASVHLSFVNMSLSVLATPEHWRSWASFPDHTLRN